MASQTEKLRQYFVSRAKRQKLLAAAAKSPKGPKGRQPDERSVRVNANSSAPSARRTSSTTTKPSVQPFDAGPSVKKSAPSPQHRTQTFNNTQVDKVSNIPISDRKASRNRIADTGPRVNTAEPRKPQRNIESLYNNMVKGSRANKGSPPSSPSRSSAPGPATPAKPSAAPRAAERPMGAASTGGPARYSSTTPSKPAAKPAPKPATRAASTSPKPASRPASAPTTSPKPPPRSLVTEAKPDKKRRRKPFEGKRAVRTGADI